MICTCASKYLIYRQKLGKLVAGAGFGIIATVISTKFSSVATHESGQMSAAWQPQLLCATSANPNSQPDRCRQKMRLPVTLVEPVKAIPSVMSGRHRPDLPALDADLSVVTTRGAHLSIELGQRGSQS